MFYGILKNRRLNKEVRELKWRDDTLNHVLACELKSDKEIAMEREFEKRFPEEIKHLTWDEYTKLGDEGIRPYFTDDEWKEFWGWRNAPDTVKKFRLLQLYERKVSDRENKKDRENRTQSIRVYSLVAVSVVVQAVILHDLLFRW